MRAGSSSTWRTIRIRSASPGAGIGSASCKRASTQETTRQPLRRHRRLSRCCRLGPDILSPLNTFSMTRLRGQHNTTLHRPRRRSDFARHSPPTTSRSMSGRRIARRISEIVRRWSAPRSPASKAGNWTPGGAAPEPGLPNPIGNGDGGAK
jgi:hypothetical protein